MVIILIGAGIIMQSFSKLVIMLNFQLNKEYISKNLCLQKEVKNNCCKGSCHLKKELDKDEKKQQAPSNNNKGLKDFQIFCQSYCAVRFAPAEELKPSLVTFGCTKPVSVTVSIFHPPKC